MSSVKERFLRYVQMDTQSQENMPTVPSTAKQFELARLLAEELTALGAEEVQVSEHCYVTATIPATVQENVPVLGLLAHMDTSYEVSGTNVHPQQTPAYDGGDIPLGHGLTLSPRDYPELLRYKGDDILTSDGSTLLGADDKAGVAEIMALCQRLMEAGTASPHGKLRIGFTPDEEIGKGTACFDVPAFGASYAYTVDGGGLGELNYENFNAADGRVTFHGVSIHPGSAKGKMVNALLLAMEFHGLLPRFMNPACTDGYEGFFHLEQLSGGTEEAAARYIIRDHDRAKFEEKKAIMTRAADYINGLYGPGTAELRITDTYYNMKEKIDIAYVEKARNAMLDAGITPDIRPIRGGTDGARLSYEGLPCPNLCTGGHNFHGKYEFISVQAMEKVVDMLERLVRL